MPTSTHSRFVRFPVNLFDALLRQALTGTQWKIVLWTVRHTYGWHRETTPFSWYRIAKETGADLRGVVRAGTSLLKLDVLGYDQSRLYVRLNDTTVLASLEDSRPPWFSEDQGDRRPPKEGLGSSIFRRAKDRCKEVNTKERKVHQKKERRAWPQREQHPAGAARPIRGKYDGLSEH